MYSELSQAFLLGSAGLTSLIQFYLIARSDSHAKNKPDLRFKPKKQRYDYILFYEKDPEDANYSNEVNLIDQLEQIKKSFPGKSTVTILRNSTTPRPNINLQKYRIKGKLTLKFRLIDNKSLRGKYPHIVTENIQIIVAPWATIRLDSLQIGQDDLPNGNRISSNEDSSRSIAQANSLNDIIDVFKSIDRAYCQQLLSLLHRRPKVEDIEVLVRYSSRNSDHKSPNSLYVISSGESIYRTSSFARQYFTQFLNNRSNNIKSPISKVRQLVSYGATNLLHRASTLAILAGLLITLIDPESLVFVYLWLWYCFFYGLLITINKRFSLRTKLQLIIYAPLAYILKLLPTR